MDDLRLIGVDEDGQHLLLAADDGTRYRLPLDDPLRAAARHDRPRLGQLQIEIEGGMRPREVQALVRRGLSAEEVAERAGWTVEKVRKFEVPILAEREHVARRARECAVGSRGDGPVTLEERVVERLRGRGVGRGDIEWDSARDEDAVWHLTMTFAAGGRRRTATWRYEPLGGSVAPTDDEARWLSEETSAGVIPTPHRAPPGEGLDVYDVDADGGIERATVTREPHEPIDLMAAMREHSARGRRGRRRGPHTPPDEPRPPEALPLGGPDEGSMPSPGVPDGPGEDPVETPLDRVRHVPTPAPVEHSAADTAEEDDDDSADEPPAAARRPGGPRRGRTSVPSWDDIVFGTKGSGPA